MDSEPLDSSENLPITDSLEASMNLAKKAFSLAFKELTSQPDADNSRYSHLDEIADVDHILPYDQDKFTDALKNLGFDDDQAKEIPAIYVGEISGDIVDGVVVRKGAKIHPEVLLHEFIHRAAEFRSIASGEVAFDERMREIMDFPKQVADKMKKDNPEEYKNTLANINRDVRNFMEGIVHWSTLYLASKIPDYNTTVITDVAKSHIEAVDEWFYDSFSKKGMTKEQIDLLILDLALTGDFSKLRKLMPIGQDLVRHGFHSDYYIENLIGGVSASAEQKSFESAVAQRKI